MPEAKLETAAADLADLAQVRAMAKDVAARFPKLDVLLNNAGVFSAAYQESADGFELSWAVNYLAVVVLTQALLETLKSNAPARVVNVSSTAHKRGQLNFDQLMMPKDAYRGYHAYGNSKLALNIYSNFLANQLDAQRVTVNTLHPGVISTKMLKIGFGMEGDPVEKGAETSVYLAVSPAVEGVTGKYFDNKQAVNASKYVYDMDMQARLWRETQKILG